MAGDRVETSASVEPAAQLVDQARQAFMASIDSRQRIVKFGNVPRRQQRRGQTADLATGSSYLGRGNGPVKVPDSQVSKVLLDPVE